MDRILLGQLGSNGDCLYATILARQLRHDFPRAEIVWAISTQCRTVAENNPHISRILEVPVADWSLQEMTWRVFEREAWRQYQRREYDAVLLSQIWPNNFHNYDGTIRPSILRAYGRPITVPIENVIRLTDHEIERVDAFAAGHRLKEREHCVLFECSSKSGQSFVTPEKAQVIADHLYRLLPDAAVIFSTHLPMELADARSLYAGTLTLREIAHLTHYVSLFAGAGSGGTVAASSLPARLIPMVILLSASTSVFASFAHDFEYFGQSDRAVVELTSEDPAIIARCIAAVCTQGAGPAREAFDGRVPVRFDHYLSLIERHLIRKSKFLDAAQSLGITAERYGWTADLLAFARQKVAPRLPMDQSWYFKENRCKGEAFRAALDVAGSGMDAPRQRRWLEGSTFSRSISGLH